MLTADKYQWAKINIEFERSKLDAQLLHSKMHFQIGLTCPEVIKNHCKPINRSSTKKH